MPWVDGNTGEIEENLGRQLGAHNLGAAMSAPIDGTGSGTYGKNWVSRPA
jgi:hypothetical protein